MKGRCDGAGDGTRSIWKSHDNETGLIEMQEFCD